MGFVLHFHSLFFAGRIINSPLGETQDSRQILLFLPFNAFFSVCVISGIRDQVVRHDAEFIRGSLVAIIHVITSHCN